MTNHVPNRLHTTLLLVMALGLLVPAARLLALDYGAISASELYKLTTPDNAQKVRIRAVIEIGDRKQSAGKELLVKLLKDDDPKVVYEVIRSLAHRMEARDTAPEIQKLLKAKDSMVVEQAIWAMEELEYSKALPDLKELADKAEDPKVAKRARKAVKHFEG